MKVEKLAGGLGMMWVTHSAYLTVEMTVGMKVGTKAEKKERQMVDD